PFVAWESARAHPPLSVALPPPPPPSAAPRVRVDETCVAPFDGCEPVPPLPFGQRTDAADPVDAASSLDADDAATLVVRGDDFDPVRDFTVQQYAELCVDMLESVDGEERVLRSYGLTGLQKAELDALWTQRMSEDTTVWLAWDRACAERRAAKTVAS